MGLPTAFHMDLRTTVHEEIHARYCKPDQELVSGLVISLRERPTTIILLNGHTLKLPRNTFSYIHISEAVTSYQGGFFFAVYKG